MSRLVYSVTCPGCSKRIHAPSEDKRRAAVVRHVRNCNALGHGKAKSDVLVPLSEVLPAELPK